jgi:ubiquinone biosynthesis protein
MGEGQGKTMIIFRVSFRFLKVFVVVCGFALVFLSSFLWDKVVMVFAGKASKSNRPVQLRRLFERLQYTYIKLGQILAMRHDFLPRHYCMELMKLLDNAPAFDDKKALKMIEKELGKPIDQLFQSFQPKHISAASFGQVYRAVLPDGQNVAVKVLRPGIRPIVYTELAFLKFFVRVIDFLCIFGSFRMEPFIADFVEYTREELDYLQEARYIRKIHNSAVQNPLEKIPRLYQHLTTGKVLTIEFLEGTWMNEILAAIHDDNPQKLDQFKQQGLDLQMVARNLMLNSLIQAFEKRYYHADPHAANICIMADNVIGYVDFGIVGRMDRRFRENTLEYLKAFFNDDIDEAYIAFLNIIQPPENIDLTGFEREMKELMSTWLEDVRDPDAPLSDRSALRRMFKEGVIMRKYRLYFPEVTSRFYRLLMISDVIILQLDPHLNVLDVTTQYLKKLMIKNYLEKLQRLNVAEVLAEGAYLTASLPKRLDAIIRRSEHLLRRSGKVIKNIKTVPAKIFSFFGKLSLFGSGVLMGLHLFMGIDFKYHFLGLTFSPTGTCLLMVGFWLLLIWLSRFLLSR